MPLVLSSSERAERPGPVQKDPMLVQCPSCHTTYRVSDNLITAPNPTFRCSRCKHIFVLGLKPEVGPASNATPAPTASPPKEEDPELRFSFTPPEKKEEIESKETPKIQQPGQPPAGEGTDQGRAEFAKAVIDAFPPLAEGGPALDTMKKEPSLTIEAEQPSPFIQEKQGKEDRWSISRRQDEERFTIPEENRSLQMDSAAESAPELEDEWQASFPLLEERETGSALDPYRDRPFSIVPYISLFGALLLIYSLLTLMYQAQPQTLETAIKTIPWLGSMVLKNNHLRHGITLQSLRPSFQTIQGNREVFILSGVAINRNAVSVREVRVEGHIFNAEGKEIDRQIISIGNAISPKIIRDLTAQEVSILQKLNPQKRFEIPPDESAGFVIVFLKPSAEVKNFSCRVASVEAGA